MSRFSYGDVRSTIAETLSFSVDAFNRLIEMRDAIIDDMAAGDYDPSMGAALKEIMMVLSEHDDLDLMRDAYVYNNFDRHVVNEILARPDDAGTDDESRVGFLNSLLGNNTHLWLLDRMKYTDGVMEHMFEAEHERLFDMAQEVLTEQLDEDADVHGGPAAKARLERAQARWYALNSGETEEEAESSILGADGAPLTTITGRLIQPITPSTLRSLSDMAQNPQSLLPKEGEARTPGNFVVERIQGTERFMEALLPTHDCDNCGPIAYDRHNESRHRMRLCENCARDLAAADPEETE